MTGQRAAAVVSLLSVLCEKANRLSSAELKACGKTARALLDFAWQDSRNRWLVPAALRCVCQTFESDPAASASLLRRALQREHLARYGFEEIPWLAREAERLIPVDSHFVRDLYHAAFGYREESEEQTALGNSRILSLISSRKQDYNHALWQLAETFPKFLERCTLEATEVLISALEFYIDSRSYAAREVPDENFLFGETKATLRPDHSSTWDRSEAYGHDDPVRMLAAFHRYLSRLAEMPDSGTQLDEILSVIARNSRLAVIWRRLLVIANHSPDTLGSKLKALLCAIPILACSDTTTEAGELLRVMFGRLSLPERVTIETTILSLPEQVPPGRARLAEYFRDRLAGCLDPALIVTDQMRNFVRDLCSKGEPPANEPLFRWSGVTGKPFGEDEYLRGEGVPIEDEANIRTRELEEPVKQFAERFRNTAPSPDEIAASFKALSDLRVALSRPGVHTKQEEYALDVLAEACSCIAGAEQLSRENPAGAFVRQVLLKASVHSNPVYDSKAAEQFDRFPSWGSPAPRIVGAEGLTKLARHGEWADEDVLKAIERLSSDRVPAVRFQIVGRILSLYHTARERMWRIVEQTGREDSSRSVVHQLVSGALGPLAGPHLEQVVDLARKILNRFEKDAHGKDLKAACLTLLTQIYVWRNEPKSKEVVYSIAVAAADATDDAFSIAGCLRDMLTHGPVQPPDPVEDDVRKRAVSLLCEMVASASRRITTIVRRNVDQNFDTWSDDDQKRMREAGRLLDHIGMEVYFASGAYDSQQRGEEKILPPEARERFYQEASSILDHLASAGFPSLVHHLLQTLESFIAIDPKGVFLKIGSTLRAGRSYGYQFEPQGAQLFVKLIERYLAEHREIFQQDAQCRQILRDTLDLFINWPAARRLVYRLEDIFR